MSSYLIQPPVVRVTHENHCPLDRRVELQLDRVYQVALLRIMLQLKLDLCVLWKPLEHLDELALSAYHGTSISHPQHTDEPRPARGENSVEARGRGVALAMLPVSADRRGWGGASVDRIVGYSNTSASGLSRRSSLNSFSEMSPLWYRQKG